MKTTTALRKIAGLKKKIKVIQGGQGASKTYSILMLLINHASSNEGKEIFVASDELTKMRLTVIKDFKTIMKAFNIFDPTRFLGGTLYNFPNGSFIKFIGLDKEDMGKGLRCDIMFVNEANKIKFETYRELTSRANQVFIDFNPNAKFWAHDEVITRSDADFIILTYKDNEYLGKQEVFEIERYKKKGYDDKGEIISEYWANKWRVYGLGQEGFIDGVIFQNWKIGEFDETLPIMYGIDFGFKDPFTLLKVAYDASTMTIYLHEEIYKSHLSPADIIQLLNTKIPNKDSLILADSADPTQIRGIKNDGFNIMGLGKEKIVIGIRHLQNWQFKVTETSQNLIRELSNYVWLDKTGEVPIDSENHLLDPLRYTEKFYRYKNS
jgi:phage terminase large subunit